MDKELPKSKLTSPPSKAFIRLNESHLPGIKAYKATVSFRSTINEDDLINRIVESGCTLHKETLKHAYRLMIGEIYNAIEDGFNVDFGLGQVEVSVNGSFTSAYDKFDRNNHQLVPSLRPSPRLRQEIGRIPAEVEHFNPHGPCPNNISTDIRPYKHDDEMPFNILEPGLPPHVSIFGSRLKLMGDLPGVGLTVRCLETGESYFIEPDNLIINSTVRLCFVPAIPFTTGDWEVEIASQFNPSYRLYTSVRRKILPFSVR